MKVNISKSDVQRIARRTWFMFLLVEGVCLLLTVVGLVDTLFDLGWGYNWNAVLIGAGIMVWGVLVWWVCRSIFRFMTNLTD